MNVEKFTKYTLYFKLFNHTQVVYAVGLTAAKEKLLVEFGFKTDKRMLRTIEEAVNIGKLTTDELQHPLYETYQTWVLKTKPKYAFIPIATKVLKNGVESYVKVDFSQYETLLKFKWKMNADGQPVTLVGDVTPTPDELIAGLAHIEVNYKHQIFLGTYESGDVSKELVDMLRLDSERKLFPKYSLHFPEKKEMYLERMEKTPNWLEMIQLKFYFEEIRKTPIVVEDKVLIVDDDSISRSVLGLQIENLWDGEILYAEDGKEALQVMRDNKPTLVILDLMLPIMDGVECLMEMRGDIELSQIPVIPYTSVDNKRTVQKLQELGISGYMLKPSMMTDVTTKISPFLSGAKRKVKRTK